MQPAVIRATHQGSKAAVVYDGVKRAIMLGELPPRARILEMELAQGFRCSQGAAREALLALQEDGLVLREPHRGTQVSDCTRDEAVEMFRIRHGAETRGALRAARRIDAAGVAELRGLMDSMERAARAGDEYALAEFDRAFHRRLFVAADLPAVEPVLHRCILHNHRFKILHSGAQRDLLETARRHDSILAALETRDPRRLADELGRHIATIVDLGPSPFEDGDAA
jgi:DNA-binding GntR family transcriptional regulator